MLCGAEVAQLGRALDSTYKVEGEAEDRVVACSNPALGTTMLNCNKPTARSHLWFLKSLASSILHS
jgi:hypothetical protein